MKFEPLTYSNMIKVEIQLHEDNISICWTKQQLVFVNRYNWKALSRRTKHLKQNTMNGNFLHPATVTNNMLCVLTIHLKLILGRKNIHRKPRTASHTSLLLWLLSLRQQHLLRTPDLISLIRDAQTHGGSPAYGTDSPNKGKKREKDANSVPNQMLRPAWFATKKFMFRSNASAST